MKIIGITGLAGSGKTTFAAMLDRAIEDISHGDSQILRRSLAFPIKKMVAELLSISVGELNLAATKAKEFNIGGVSVTARKLMQTLGTEWGRDQIDPDIWLGVMRDSVAIGTSDEGDGFLIIDDVRFQNEADWVTGHGSGGFLIRINRGLVSCSSHRSEEVINKVPHRVVYNCGDIPSLRAEAYRVALEILHPSPEEGPALKGHETSAEDTQVIREATEAMSGRRLNDVTSAEWDAASQKSKGTDPTAWDDAYAGMA